MDKKASAIPALPHAAATKTILIISQLLALLAYALALQFLHHTTGGTLFLFATIAPLLVVLASAGLIVIVVDEFRRRYSLFTFETYAPYQIIFRQGDEGDRAFFIHSGEVEVARQQKGGETVLARLIPGQYFGEMALIRNQPRNATVRAVTNVRVAVLGKRNFLAMLSILPSTQDDILKTINERAMEKAAE